MLHKIWLKFLVAFIFSFALLFFVTSSVSAATYYVANAGNDSCNGISQTIGSSGSCAWKTVAKVNASSFGADDSILFNRGDTWREQLLIPSSGTSGHPITFGAYGTGNKPLIQNSTELVSATWTQYAATPSGSVTEANMKTSVVNGTAFTDFSSANVLTSYPGSKLTITDHAGKKLIGYIKAAGTGETYGSQLMANTAFNNTTSVQGNCTLSSVAGGQTGNALQMTVPSGTSCQSSEVFATSNGALYLLTGYLKIGTGNAIQSFFEQNFGAFNTYQNYYNQSASWTPYTLYGTADGTSFLHQWTAYGTSTQTDFVDTVSTVQVITPSSTGVTITSTANGSTYNWTSEDAGFNRNDSSNYTYSIDASNPNIYYASGVTTDVGIMVFNSGASMGVRKITLGTLASQGDFYYDSVGQKLYLYSASAPGTYYSSIEAGKAQSAILDSLKSHIVIQDFNVRYSGSSDIEVNAWSSPVDDVVVQRNDMSLSGNSTGGNGIQAYSGTMSNITIRDNTANNIYDAGITAPQDGEVSAFSNIYVYNNIITNCEHGIEIGAFTSGTTVNGLYIYNNDIYNSGGGFSHSQRSDPYGDGFIMWSMSGATVSNMKVENNIVSNSIYNVLKGDTNWAGETWDYNLYYPDGATKFGYNAWPIYSNAYNLANWKTTTGQDAHSITSDPVFVSTGIDFHLQSTSPAIDAGVNVSLISDYEGNHIWQGMAPDIGAYEYQSGSSAGTTSNNSSVSSSPNSKSGWSYPVIAGPNHVGITSFIMGRGTAGDAMAYIPDNAHHDDIYLTIDEVSLNDLSNRRKIPFPWSQGWNLVGDIYNFNAVSSFNGFPIPQFDHPAMVVLPYNLAKLKGISPKNLKIGWYDTSTKKWKVLPSRITVINQLAHTIASTTKNFSYFAVVYPNQNQTSVLGASVEKLKPVTTLAPTPTTVPTQTLTQTLAPQQTQPIAKPKSCFLWWCF
jgi:hypothetical protein